MSEVAAHPLPRRGRLWVLALLLFGLFGLGYALVGIATQKGGKPVVRIAGINETQEIFGGVEQAGDRLGSASAPVTIQVFNDLQCATCRKAFLTTIPGLVEPYVRSGQVKLLYRHYSVAENPTEVGFYGAEAAAQQGDGWQYTYLFFRNQEEAKRQGVTQGFLDSIANSVEEMNVPEWKSYLEKNRGPNGAIARKLAASEKLATDLEVRTPREIQAGEEGIQVEGQAMVVTGPRGSHTLLEGPTLSQIEAAIKSVQ
ncbi:MAG TPA: thioredoxin domain-containing protein [Solirubrobacterales bacterium]|nr:thioredoxin domain-containing protein [Solirubrobacterales bacterium]